VRFFFVLRSRCPEHLGKPAPTDRTSTVGGGVSPKGSPDRRWTQNSPTSGNDARKTTLREIRQRRGSPNPVRPRPRNPTPSWRPTQQGTGDAVNRKSKEGRNDLHDVRVRAGLTLLVLFGPRIPCGQGGRKTGLWIRVPHPPPHGIGADPPMRGASRSAQPRRVSDL